MPIGGFLDSFPAVLFILVHLVALALGAYAIWRMSTRGSAYAWAFALYALSQVAFLAFFGGAFTLKMAVLIEQVLVMALVVWIIASPAGATRARPG